MNLSFIPGELYLKKANEDCYVVSLRGEEVLVTPSLRKAIAKFKKLRLQLEAQFPTHDLSEQEKMELLNKNVIDSILEKSSRRVQKRRIRPGSTRTFG